MDVLALVATCGLAARAALFMPLAGPPACMNPAFTTHGNARDAAAAWQPETVATAHRFDIPAAWIAAVMRAESGCQATVGGEAIHSPAGAIGLMQAMPQTCAALRARYGLAAGPRSPHDNILAGAANLRELLDRYGMPWFLVAYNAGPAGLDGFVHSGGMLPAETQRYLATLAPQIGVVSGCVAAGGRDYGSEHEVCSGGSFPGPERCRRRRPLRDRNHASRRASGTRGAADRETEFGADACADGGGGWSDCSQT